MGRPKSQNGRREQLVLSALDAIRDRGIRNLRIRDIAEGAKVSTGTIHYHFADIDEIIYAVHSGASDRFFSDRFRAISELEDARDQLGSLVASGLPTSSDDAVVIALYEIDLYRRGDPAHMLLGQALFDRQVALYFGTLQLGVSQGHFTLNAPAQDIAQTLVALEDACGMHIIYGNRSLMIDRSSALLLGYSQTATSCSEIGTRTTPTKSRSSSNETSKTKHRALGNQLRGTIS
ncbi:TetR/AcrR family transcriptional regulator [Salinibacterium sp.]|uniref:TetR/AcrR family transcriptional regulator n=1 Tax=Salinibacterium sp. TaxID=1915057 RepID=UPI00286A61C0|nr:TetR/AcrR family transcriptional regulator [Salinibacterium sp.]